MDPDPSQALRDLAAALDGDYSIETRLDPVARTVDATAIGVSARGPCQRIALRALLRKRQDEHWWWLMIPRHDNGLPGQDHAPEVIPLAPLGAVETAARRIFRALILDQDIAP